MNASTPLKQLPKWTKTLLYAGALFLAGCGAPLPENPRGSAPKADPAMAAQRIKQTIDNPNFTPAEKATIIATIKQKNHIQ
jgi:hypothetical protein